MENPAIAEQIQLFELFALVGFYCNLISLVFLQLRGAWHSPKVLPHPFSITLDHWFKKPEIQDSLRYFDFVNSFATQKGVA